MSDDVIINKCGVIENCLKRIREEYRGHEDELLFNYTKQDSIILNLQRAAEATIDLGMRWVRIEKLGTPQTSREVFEFLAKKHLIPQALSHELQLMVGFRNIAIHDYQKINLEIIKSILTTKLKNFEEIVHLARLHSSQTSVDIDENKV